MICIVLFVLFFKDIFSPCPENWLHIFCRLFVRHHWDHHCEVRCTQCSTINVVFNGLLTGVHREKSQVEDKRAYKIESYHNHSSLALVDFKPRFSGANGDHIRNALSSQCIAICCCQRLSKSTLVSWKHGEIELKLAPAFAYTLFIKLLVKLLSHFFLKFSYFALLREKVPLVRLAIGA